MAHQKVVGLLMRITHTLDLQKGRNVGIHSVLQPVRIRVTLQFTVEEHSDMRLQFASIECANGSVETLIQIGERFWKEL